MIVIPWSSRIKNSGKLYSGKHQLSTLLCLSALIPNQNACSFFVDYCSSKTSNGIMIESLTPQLCISYQPVRKVVRLQLVSKG